MDAGAKVAAVVLVALLLASAPAAAEYSATWDEHGLNYYFGTTSDTFAMYENVPMTYVVTNATQETLAVEHPCGGLGGIEFGVYAPPNPWHPEGWYIWGCCGCFPMSWIDFEFGPGETYVGEATWPMENMGTGLPIQVGGVYRLDGFFSASLFPSGEAISHDFSLEIMILTVPTTGAPEEPRTWSAVKALYRRMPPHSN